MKSVFIDSIESPWFPALWETYEFSFPANERRRLDDQKGVLGLPGYRLQAWLDEDAFVGLTGSWELGNFHYLEHFAVIPEARSKGYGQNILTSWLGMSDAVAVLEIEPAVDDLSARRLAFYKRFGFLENPHKHGHPSYLDWTGDVPMWLLSNPRPITAPEHSVFVDMLKNRVWQG